MTLEEVKFAPDRAQKLMYRCITCRSKDTVILADPLKTEVIGWLSGELRPPK